MSRFVIHYIGNSDPSSAEESRLVFLSKNATIIDRMPRSLLIEAPEPPLAGDDAAFAQWRVTPEAQLWAVPSPHKRILHRRVIACKPAAAVTPCAVPRPGVRWLNRGRKVWQTKKCRTR